MFDVVGKLDGLVRISWHDGAFGFSPTPAFVSVTLRIDTTSR